MSSGVYPGSFNPPTIAHLEIAEVARTHYGLDRVDLAISEVALDKESVVTPSFAERLAVIRSSCAHLDWLEVVVTPHQLLVDIARGYDMLIMGEDKWGQIHQLRYYHSPAHMAECLSQLPALAITPRSPTADGPRLDQPPIPASARLDVADWAYEVSSSGARSGHTDWMTPQAAASGHW